MSSSNRYESSVVRSTYSPRVRTASSVVSSVPLEGSSLQGGAISTDSVQVRRYQSAKPAVASESASQEVEAAKTAAEDNAATLTVEVPENAIVTVNGHKTQSEGAVRQYLSKGLQPGYVYTYVVKAVFDVDGVEQSETKSIKLRAGDVQRLEFSATLSAESEEAQPQEDDLVTTVKLHVPEGSEVELAGTRTGGEGATRTYRTTQLDAGQKWEGYTIRVTAMIDGQPVTKERTVDVEAGSVTELTFDFDEQVVASL